MGIREGKIGMWQRNGMGMDEGSSVGVFSSIGESDLQYSVMARLPPNLDISLVAFIVKVVETSRHNLGPKGQQFRVGQLWDLLSDEIIGSVAVISKLIGLFVVTLTSTNHNQLSNQEKDSQDKYEEIKEQPVISQLALQIFQRRSSLIQGQVLILKPNGLFLVFPYETDSYPLIPIQYDQQPSFLHIFYIQQSIIYHFRYLFEYLIAVMGSVESSQLACRAGYSRFRSKGRVGIYHFGELQLFYDQLSHQQVICAVYEFILEADSEQQFMGKLRNNNNNCPYLVSMVKIQTQVESVCANTNTYHVYFEYLPLTLQQLLSRQREPFSETETRLLLSCLLEAVKFINDRETYHGDIYPQFIYLDDRGQRRYKIFDSAYFNPLKHGYYRALDQASYCSPQVLANVSERRTFPLYNHFVSDTFSIGLVCLYAMTLISPLTAYKAKTKEIDYYYIQNLLRIASRNGFSGQLLSCVGECVQLKNRPTAGEILDNYEFLRGLGNCQKLSLRK